MEPRRGARLGEGWGCGQVSCLCPFCKATSLLLGSHSLLFKGLGGELRITQCCGPGGTSCLSFPNKTEGVSWAGESKPCPLKKSNPNAVWQVPVIGAQFTPKSSVTPRLWQWCRPFHLLGRGTSREARLSGDPSRDSNHV